MLYGLTQRKAIAREVATGHIRRFGIVLDSRRSLGFFTAVTYWRFRNWELPTGGAEEGDLAFPGETPLPTTPEQDARRALRAEHLVASRSSSSSGSCSPAVARVRHRGTTRAAGQALGRRPRRAARGRPRRDARRPARRGRPAPRDHRRVRAPRARARGERHSTPHVGDVGRVPPARPPRPRARRASSRTPDGALHAG